MRLVTLLGPEPILNLLAIRALQPQEILFVGTKDTHTVAQHLQKLTGSEVTVYQTELLDPFDVAYISKSIKKKFRKLGWQPGEIVFDLSGGSKILFYAAIELAKKYESPMADIERIGYRYRIRQFEFQGHVPTMIRDEYLPPLISIGDYLNCYWPGFQEDGFSRDSQGQVDIGGRFEQTVYQVLVDNVDELLSGVRPKGVSNQIEIDLIVRQGNNVGIIEAKTGVKKAGIDQLDTAGNPHFTGDFLQKLLVTGRYLPRAHKALASAQQIRVIELPGYTDHSGLPAAEKRLLINSVQQVLSGR